MRGVSHGVKVARGELESLSSSKTDASLFRRIVGHHLADRLEHDPELPVVLPFEGGELSRKIRVLSGDTAQTHEGAHDLQAHDYGDLAVQKALATMSAPCSVKARGLVGENLRRARWSRFATTSAFSSALS